MDKRLKSGMDFALIGYLTPLFGFQASNLTKLVQTLSFLETVLSQFFQTSVLETANCEFQLTPMFCTKKNFVPHF